MRRVLITGGAGFIGSHLAEACLARGDLVSVIDDLSTGRLDNVAHLVVAHPDRFRFEQDSIFSQATMRQLVRDCDVVVHLAAAVGVKYIIDNPIDSLTTNLSGTELVLNQCCVSGKKVFIASSSEVYGKKTDAPLRESDDCVYGPSSKFRWSYAASKLMDEFYAHAFHRVHGLPVVIGRLFNVVGPRQSAEYGMVLPRFVAQALAGEPLTVFADGRQTRTFAHVAEVVECIMGLLDCDAASGEVVNIGGEEEVSILELATRVKARTASTSEIRHVNYEEIYPRDFEDMQRRVPSTDKLRGLIGQAPTRDLDAILDDMITHARDRPAGPTQAAGG